MIPAFVNKFAGTADAATRALLQEGGFDVHESEPRDLAARIGEALELTPDRIVIAGGDGSVATAAAVVCDTSTALAVLPGGTLNHFARDHGIPLDLAEACKAAKHGETTNADVARVNDRVFLNTSSVGAYVAYVRFRDRAEKWLGYRLASLLAVVRMLIFMRPVALELEVDGQKLRYDTLVAFIGVGERETKSPILGNRVEGGRRCLHLIVVRERRAARLLVVALDAAARGLDRVAHTPKLDSFMTDACVIRMRGKRQHIAVDGEVVAVEMPLEYSLAKDSLRIVVPVPNTSEEEPA